MEKKASPDSRNIYQRILAVTASVESFSKDSRNTQFNFKYASIERVVQEIQAACIENGIALLHDSIAQPQTVNHNKSGEIVLVNAEIIMRAINVDNPADYAEVRIHASGYDTLDKGMYKAISGGRKYAIFAMFNLMAGEAGKDEPDATIDIT